MTGGGTVAIQSPLWHQGSGISVTSSYGDELRGNAALLAMATGARVGNGGNLGGGGGGHVVRTSGQRRGGGSKIGSDGEGHPISPRTRRKPVHRDDEIAMPPPKRALSAPAAVLLAEAAAAAAAMAAEEPQIAAFPGINIGLNHTHHPLGLLNVSSPLQLPLQSLMLPLPPPPLGALSGSADPSPEALSAAIGWMHDVALCLDKELEDTDREKTNAAAGPSSFQISAPLVSPSGRFQALLGFLRGTPACLYGTFESLVRRYNYFASNPHLQRQKLVELILATLIEAAAPRDLFKSVEAHAAEAAAEAAPKVATNAETKGAAVGGQTPTLTASPSPSLLNNAKNNNLINNEHQGQLKIGIDDEEADGAATVAII